MSDPALRGIQTAKRISGLVDELQLEVDRQAVIINKIYGDEGAELKNVAEEAGLNVAGLVPQDDAIFNLDLQGKPILYLPEDSKAVRAVFSILDSLKIP